MFRANYKQVSESVRLWVKISRCKAQSVILPGVKVGNDNVIDSPGLKCECL